MLTYFRKKLLQEKKSLLKSIINFSNEEKRSIKDSTGELSSYDNHPADEASNTYEREKDLSIKDNSMILLKKVDIALKLIKNNEYGNCRECGNEINLERLETIPYTIVCKNCSEKEENKVEYSFDHISEKKEFVDDFFEKYYVKQMEKINANTEEAWEEVAKYGTSATESENGLNDFDPED